MAAVCARVLDQSLRASSISQNAASRSKDRVRRLIRRAITASSDQEVEISGLPKEKARATIREEGATVIASSRVERSLVANDSIPRAPIPTVFSFKNAQTISIYRMEIRRVSSQVNLVKGKRDRCDPQRQRTADRLSKVRRVLRSCIPDQIKSTTDQIFENFPFE